MVIKEGHNWKACYDETQDKYTAVYELRGSTVIGTRYYEIDKETFDKLLPDNNKDSVSLITEGRMLYCYQNEQNCGPVCEAYDINWQQICAGLLNS